MIINNVLIELKPGHPLYQMEEERLRCNGRCEECNQPNTDINWCKACNAIRLRKAFSTWTSGNAEIDYFIQNAQIHATHWELVLEWYPWETFSNVEQTGEGGFGTVFRAKRKVLAIKQWDHKTKEWLRQEADGNGDYVALKTIGHSESLSKEFLDEVV